ncbi:hypothetical protein H5410_057614 [Solanum commersonii]|uniref:Uncharacterized protein n=1 Tax=Solanum commersonii TaxID=4109 RepID=A0A9J5WR41_SOLCO|nr:hypothetical protein H5410_057614 [Solanum commersonii]
MVKKIFPTSTGCRGQQNPAVFSESCMAEESLLKEEGITPRTRRKKSHICGLLDLFYFTKVSTQNSIS